MKNIVIPTDFSELSLKGLELALLMTKETKAKIELVHVLKKAENMSFKQEDIKTDQVNQTFDSLLKQTKKKHPDEKLSYTIKEGKIQNKVTNVASSKKDSVIVTSTHGASGWEELFTGSNAYKIVAAAERPVFTVRGKEIPNQIRKIVLPLDTTLETREKVPFTMQLAELFNAEVHIVSVSKSDIDEVKSKLADYKAQVNHYLSDHNIKTTTDDITGDNLTDITIEYAKKVDADLISIMTEQEKDVKNILLGSYAHQMINKSPVPVLLYPTKQIGKITESFRTLGIKY